MSETERKARVFMHENAPLIEDGGVSTLERVVIDGSQILIDLSKELQEATQALTRNQYALAAAIDSKAPPKKFHALEVEERRLKRVLKLKQEAHGRFDAFWNRANETYKKRLTENDTEVVAASVRGKSYLDHETSGTGSTVTFTPRPKRGFFSRLFG